ncbi:hypothetical protein D3C80_1151780 [compost metagenome]
MLKLKLKASAFGWVDILPENIFFDYTTRTYIFLSELLSLGFYGRYVVDGIYGELALATFLLSFEFNDNFIWAYEIMWAYVCVACAKL